MEFLPAVFKHILPSVDLLDNNHFQKTGVGRNPSFVHYNHVAFINVLGGPGWLNELGRWI